MRVTVACLAKDLALAAATTSGPLPAAARELAEHAAVQDDELDIAVLGRTPG